MTTPEHYSDENRAALMQRIGNASTPAELTRLEASATRVYYAGQLTVAHFAAIDAAIMEKLARIES